MAVAVCTIYLRIPENHSLKGKRQVMQSLIARVRKDFNVSIAEMDQQDSWQTSTLGVACISSDSAYAHGLLARVVQAISAYRLDAEILDYEIEIY